MSRNNDSMISINNYLFRTMKCLLICLVIAIIVGTISGVIISYFAKNPLIEFSVGFYYGIFCLFILGIIRCRS